jgi:peptide/nickel transport system permease protein
VARVAESVTTQIRNQDYVEAARATGAANWRIVFGHVLSNVTGPILIYASSLISVSIVIASGLSFLGLGIVPPEAEWGLMLNTLRQSIYVAPLNAVLPGVMIFMTSMCSNLISDGLRSAMDVKV